MSDSDEEYQEEQERVKQQESKTPDWVEDEPKVAIYWRAKYEEKSDEVDEMKALFQDNLEGREERFVEIIRSIGFNRATSASRPIASMGSDINVGLTAEELIEGAEPIVALGLAGITIAGIVGSITPQAPSLPLWVTLGSLGLSLGTGIDWYRRRSSSDETDSISRLPERMEERM